MCGNKADQLTCISVYLFNRARTSDEAFGVFSWPVCVTRRQGKRPRCLSSDGKDSCRGSRCLSSDLSFTTLELSSLRFLERFLRRKKMGLFCRIRGELMELTAQKKNVLNRSICTYCRYLHFSSERWSLFWSQRKMKAHFCCW
jgi:hypothetical protein